MDRLRAFWNRGWFAKAIVGVVGLLVLCCVIGILVPRRTPTASTTSQPTVAAAAVAPVAVAQATAASEPTSAPLPTEAPTTAPSPTEAPTAVPTEPPAPSIAAVGDRVEANGMALTVIKVDQATKVGTFQKADAGNIFVLAEVLIENISQDEIPYNPFYFKVKDADGFEYNVGLNTGDQSLKSGKLTKGDKARGIVLFEVKESATGLVMEYKPIVLFSGDEPIKIKLN